MIPTIFAWVLHGLLRAGRAWSQTRSRVGGSFRLNAHNVYLLVTDGLVSHEGSFFPLPYLDPDQPRFVPRMRSIWPAARLPMPFPCGLTTCK